MEYLTVIILAVMSVFSIFGGFYFGYKLGKNDDFVQKIAEKVEQKSKKKVIKNSVIDRSDEDIAQYEENQKIAAEDKARREQYGLPT